MCLLVEQPRRSLRFVSRVRVLTNSEKFKLRSMQTFRNEESINSFHFSRALLWSCAAFVVLSLLLLLLLLFLLAHKTLATMGGKDEEDSTAETQRIIVVGRPCLDRCDNMISTSKYNIITFLPIVSPKNYLPSSVSRHFK